MSNRKPITYKNVEYESIKAFCEVHNICQNQFRKYYRKGFDVERVLDILSQKEINYKGENYSSIDVLARRLGLNAKILQFRQQRGMTLEEAIEEPVWTEKMQEEPFEYEGKRYKNIVQFCYMNCFNSDKMKSLLNRGYPFREAVKALDELQIVFKGNVYEDLATFASSNGLSLVLVKKRLDAGWTLEDIVSSYPHKSKRVQGQLVIFDGKSYPSLLELCKKEKIKIEMLNYYLNKGYNLKTAIKLLSK